mmetsp:Transcript_1376/g.3953  ORF Transcript_1376/g.3953 Transcript_1376/m.3953 type:complete len:450 (+) Transcript_1376:57-1406(+)
MEDGVMEERGTDGGGVPSLHLRLPSPSTSLIEEVLLGQDFEPLELVLPLCDDLVHLKTALDAGSHQLVPGEEVDPVSRATLHPIEPPLVLVHIVGQLNDLDADPDRIQLPLRATLGGQGHLHPAASLVRVLAHHRNKISFPYLGPVHLQLPQRVRVLPAHVGRPYQLERQGSPPPLANVHPLDESKSHVKVNARGGGQVRARGDVGQPGIRKRELPSPVLHRHHLQVGLVPLAEVLQPHVLLVKQVRQLPYRHPVLHTQRPLPHAAAEVRIEDRAADPLAPQGVWPVQNHNLHRVTGALASHLGPRRGHQHIIQAPYVSIEPSTTILEVNKHHLRSILLHQGQDLLVALKVDAVHLQARPRVHGGVLPSMPRLLSAPEPVLRRQHRCQLHAGARLSQSIHGMRQVRKDGRSVGEDARRLATGHNFGKGRRGTHPIKTRRRDAALPRTSP